MSYWVLVFLSLIFLWATLFPKLFDKFITCIKNLIRKYYLFFITNLPKAKRYKRRFERIKNYILAIKQDELSVRLFFLAIPILSIINFFAILINEFVSDIAYFIIIFYPSIAILCILNGKFVFTTILYSKMKYIVVKSLAVIFILYNIVFIYYLNYYWIFSETQTLMYTIIIIGVFLLALLSNIDIFHLIRKNTSDAIERKRLRQMTVSIAASTFVCLTMVYDYIQVYNGIKFNKTSLLMTILQQVFDVNLGFTFQNNLITILLFIAVIIYVFWFKYIYSLSNNKREEYPVENLKKVRLPRSKGKIALNIVVFSVLTLILVLSHITSVKNDYREDEYADDEITQMLNFFESAPFFTYNGKTIGAVMSNYMPDNESYTRERPLHLKISLKPEEDLTLKKIEIRFINTTINKEPVIVFRQKFTDGCFTLSVVNKGWGDAKYCDYMLSDKKGLLKKYFGQAKLIGYIEDLPSTKSIDFVVLGPQNALKPANKNIKVKPELIFLYNKNDGSFGRNRIELDIDELLFSQNGIVGSNYTIYEDNAEAPVSANVIMVQTDSSYSYHIDSNVPLPTNVDTPFSFDIITDKSCTLDYYILLTFSDGKTVFSDGVYSAKFVIPSV